MATCPACSKHFPEDVATCSVDGEPLIPDDLLPAVDRDLAAGAIVSEYRIESKLGEGGFGAVYSAVHPVIGKPAAIKVLHRQYSVNPQMVSRFIAEARAVNQIRHRNIIDIFGFSKLPDGRQYYVMELLEGVTLERFLRERGPLPPEEAVPILRGIARALDAAHANGIAHRDLKPDNVFLAYDEDGAPFPKLLDFGIAKLLGEDATAHKTRTGAPIGTPHYMSPEQCRGRNVDHRTDVYSFGVLTHQALTGALPFDGDDAMAVMVAHTGKEPPRASKVCPSVPAALDEPILAMLAKDQQARPTSVGIAIEAVAKAAESAGVVIPGAPVRPPAEPTRRAISGAPDRRPSTGGGATPAAPQARVQPTPMTPTDVAALAEATTMASDEGPSPKTLLDSESDVVAGGPRPPSRRRGLLLGAVALAAGAAALAMAAWSGPRTPREPGAAQEAPGSVPSLEATAATVAVDQPTATATASAEVVAPALSAAPQSSAAASASARAPATPPRAGTARPTKGTSRELEAPTY